MDGKLTCLRSVPSSLDGFTTSRSFQIRTTLATAQPLGGALDLSLRLLLTLLTIKSYNLLLQRVIRQASSLPVHPAHENQ